MEKGREVFEQIVDQYKVRAFHFLLQMVGNREDAMDLTQEAFLRVHQHWYRRDGSRPFGPWFYLILRNLAVDHFRKRKARKEDPLEVVPEAEELGPEILAEQSERKAVVWGAIRRLSPAQREVVILRDLHGLSYAEIAQTTGESVTTVNSRLHHAREVLRKKLERYL